MTRAEQYVKFLSMVIELLKFCRNNEVPVRLGEAHRPAFVAEKYAAEGIGIIKSKHRYSLAIDIWIYCKGGMDIDWKDPRYEIMGKFWEGMGGTWGGNFKKLRDLYHFELADKVAR